MKLDELLGPSTSEKAPTTSANSPKGLYGASHVLPGKGFSRLVWPERQGVPPAIEYALVMGKIGGKLSGSIQTKPRVRPTPVDQPATGQEIAAEATVWNFTRLVIGSKIGEEWMKTLESIEILPDGWDSYSAPAPSQVAVTNAKTLLKEAETLVTKPDRVEPSAMGGVGVTFSSGDREVVIEFYNKGTAHALFADDAAGKMHTQAVPTDPSGYRTFIGEVRKYLYGE